MQGLIHSTRLPERRRRITPRARQTVIEKAARVKAPHPADELRRGGDHTHRQPTGIPVTTAGRNRRRLTPGRYDNARPLSPSAGGRPGMSTNDLPDHPGLQAAWRFASTRWSVVAAAGEKESPEGRA